MDGFWNGKSWRNSCQSPERTHPNPSLRRKARRKEGLFVFFKAGYYAESHPFLMQFFCGIGKGPGDGFWGLTAVCAEWRSVFFLKPGITVNKHKNCQPKSGIDGCKKSPMHFNRGRQCDCINGLVLFFVSNGYVCVINNIISGLII